MPWVSAFLLTKCTQTLHDELAVQFTQAANPNTITDAGQRLQTGTCLTLWQKQEALKSTPRGCGSCRWLREKVSAQNTVCETAQHL
jgi:hypothetical protein